MQTKAAAKFYRTSVLDHKLPSFDQAFRSQHSTVEHDYDVVGAGDENEVVDLLAKRRNSKDELRKNQFTIYAHVWNVISNFKIISYVLH